MRSLNIAYEELASRDEQPEHWSGPPELVERSAALAGTRRRDRIPDVGCGVGGPARMLAAMGCRVVADDALRRDLADGRLRPALVLARKGEG